VFKFLDLDDQKTENFINLFEIYLVLEGPM